MIALIAALACGGGDTDDTDSAAFSPVMGTYDAEADALAGSCGADATEGGRVTATNFIVSVSDEIPMGLQSMNHETFQHGFYACVLTDRDFDCEAEPRTVDVSVSSGTVPVRIVSRVVGAFTDERHFAADFAAALTCDADLDACAEVDALWNLQMPCSLSRLHHATRQ